MSKHYFVGSGIASLAGATFLVRDAAVRGTDIVIFEAAPGFGGALEAHGSAASGYAMYGNRMFSGEFACTFDLMASIPAVSNPHISVNEESACAAASHAPARVHLMPPRSAAATAVSSGLDERHREALCRLLATPEPDLDGRSVQDCFDEDFFRTAFWLEWSTLFALRRWHSAAEWRRYLRRRAGQAAAAAEDLYRTRFSPYESLALPLQRWLAAQGVQFRFRTQVSGLVLDPDPGQLQATALHLEEDGQARELAVDAQDRVFVCLGSMTAAATFGSMIEPAPLAASPASVDAWALWRQLAATRPGLGRPEVFCDQVDRSQWTSFTVTTDDPTFFSSLARFRGQASERGELVRFNASGWMLTLALYHQPLFMDQPDRVSVWWGYGLAHDQPGDLVRKPMRECTGAEILEEVLYQLKCPAHERETILGSSNCIPCTLPHVTSPFLVRARGDRMAPVPAGSRNLGFIGQYVELADELALTVEYSVRSAQQAVYTLAAVDRPLPTVYVDDELPGAMVERLVEAAAWTSS